jgi:hypothetical protein
LDIPNADQQNICLFVAQRLHNLDLGLGIEAQRVSLCREESAHVRPLLMAGSSWFLPCLANTLYQECPCHVQQCLILWLTHTLWLPDMCRCVGLIRCLASCRFAPTHDPAALLHISQGRGRSSLRSSLILSTSLLYDMYATDLPDHVPSSRRPFALPSHSNDIPAPPKYAFTSRPLQSCRPVRFCT